MKKSISEKQTEIKNIPKVKEFISALNPNPETKIEEYYNFKDYPKKIQDALSKASKKGNSNGIPDGLFFIGEYLFCLESKGSDIQQAKDEAIHYSKFLLPTYKDKLFLIAIDHDNIWINHPINDQDLNLCGFEITLIGELEKWLKVPLFLKKSFLRFLNPLTQQQRQERSLLFIKTVQDMNSRLRNAGIGGSHRIDVASTLLLIKEIMEESNYIFSGFDYTTLRSEKFSVEAKIDFINDSLPREMARVYPHIDPKLISDKKNIIDKSIFEHIIKSEKTNPSKPHDIRMLFCEMFSIDVDLRELDFDIRGKIVEEFSHGNKGGGVSKEQGEFFTPRHIIKLCVDIANPNHGDKILDPTFGTGGFLTEAFKTILEKNGGVVSEILKKETIYGVELQSWNVKAAKASLLALGDGHSNLFQEDFNSFDMTAIPCPDIVLMNPPYATGFEWSFVLKTFNYQKQQSQEDGKIRKLIAILPYGKVISKELNQEIKKNIEAIISFPYGVFLKYTATKTVALVLSTKPVNKDKALIYKVFDDGYTLDNFRRPIDCNDIPEALDTFKKFKEGKIINNGSKYALIKRDDLYNNESHIDKVLFNATTKFLNIHPNEKNVGKISEFFDLITKEGKAGLGDYANYPYLEIGGVDVNTSIYVYSEKENMKGIVCKKGDLVISKVRTYRGGFAIIQEDCIATTGFIVLRPKNKKNVDSKDLLSTLKKNLTQIKNYTSFVSKGTTYPTVENSDILNIYFSPDVAKQDFDDAFNEIMSYLKKYYS